MIFSLFCFLLLMFQLSLDLPYRRPKLQNDGIRLGQSRLGLRISSCGLVECGSEFVNGQFWSLFSHGQGIGGIQRGRRMMIMMQWRRECRTCSGGCGSRTVAFPCWLLFIIRAIAVAIVIAITWTLTCTQRMIRHVASGCAGRSRRHRPTNTGTW